MESIEVIREELKRLKKERHDYTFGSIAYESEKMKEKALKWVLEKEIEVCIEKLKGWKVTSNYTAQNFYEEKINKLIEVLEETK